LGAKGSVAPTFRPSEDAFGSANRIKKVSELVTSDKSLRATDVSVAQRWLSLAGGQETSQFLPAR
jgi:hypothetical protein